MYSRIFKFLIRITPFTAFNLVSDKNILQYIDTEDIRKNLDDGNTGCGIFVDTQKAFVTVEHDFY